MLRKLVLLLVLVNAGLYWWLDGNPQALQSDREPQRLEHQVAPDAVQVLPDLPAASAPRDAASATADHPPAASDPATGQATAPAPEDATSMPARSTPLACAETPPLNDAEFSALKATLTKAGLPDAAIGERHQTKGGAWIVYLGRFDNAAASQEKAAELRKLGLKFERVNAPAALAPGLSLGQFASQDEAAKKLADLRTRGVHTARVAVLDEPILLRHLQVHAADTAWRHATIGQRFDNCPAS